MSAFKVGDKVRVRKDAAIVAPNCLDVPGAEGVLLRPYGCSAEWVVSVPTHPYPEVIIPEEYLAPLTDPKAEAFIEQLKKLKPLHEEPLVKRTVEAK